jgi:predicted DNA-binding transcriptional regulator AlpA
MNQNVLPAPQDNLPAIFANNRILNIRQMAELWGVSVPTIRRLHRSGKIPSAIRISERRIGWRAGDALSALAAREAAAREVKKQALSSTPQKKTRRDGDRAGLLQVNLITRL